MCNWQFKVRQFKTIFLSLQLKKMVTLILEIKDAFSNEHAGPIK